MKHFLWSFLLSSTMITTANAACIVNSNGSYTCSVDGNGDINEEFNSDVLVTSSQTPRYAIILSDATGEVNFVNNGDITSEYTGGISYNPGSASHVTSKVSIVQNGNIYRSGSAGLYGLYASNYTGDSEITLNGNILVDNATTTTHGIVARAYGTNTVRLADGAKIVLQASTKRDLKGISIGEVGETSNIYLGKNSLIDTYYGGDRGMSITTENLFLNMDVGSKILAGYQALFISELTGTGTVINSGTIDSLSSLSIVLNNSSTGTLDFYNNGTYNGVITSYATGVANVKNYGTLNLINPDFYGMSPTSIVTTGQYLVDGNSVHNMNNGAMQAAFQGLSTFANSGVIDMTYNSHAGDVLVLTSNAAGGTSGGTSNYISNGGSLKIDTVLNEGGANSASDVLVVDNTVLGSGATNILVKNAGGKGAETIGDGIKVVEVKGTSSDAGSFKLGSSLTAGIYEYTLHQGDLAGVDALSWYLRANSANVSPKIGGVLATQSAMNDIFMHGLYDRLGRPSFIDNCSEVYNKYGMWARIEGRNASGSVDASAKFDTDIYSTQIGSDIYRTDLEKGSVHVGLMGSYGRIKTESKSKTTGSKAHQMFMV